MSVLRAQDNGCREAKRLDGLWEFVADPGGVGRSEEWWRAPLAGSRPMPVPSAFDDVVVEPPLHDHVGDVWYQRVVHVPRGWDGRRIVLRFDAATHRAVVWAGDEQVGEHEGGYTPFEADLTAVAVAGEPLRVTVVVNNELTWTSIPPGVIHDLRRGEAQAVLLPGLLQLRRPDPQRLAVRDRADAPGRRHGRHGPRRRHGGRGLVAHRRGRRRRSGSCSATPTARRSAEGEGGAGELRVPDVHRWAPGDGYLYDLQVDVLDGDVLVDRYHQTVGRPDGAGGRHPVPDQRRAVPLQGLRHARGPERPGHGPRRRLDGPRLRAAGLAGGQLVPDLALPLRRGGPRPRRPARGRGHRRDRRRGPQPQHQRRDLRRRRPHDVHRGDGRRRGPGRAPAGHRGAHRPRPEPPLGGAVEPGQRARVQQRGVGGLLRAALRRRPGGRPDAGRSASST